MVPNVLYRHLATLLGGWIAGCRRRNDSRANERQQPGWLLSTLLFMFFWLTFWTIGGSFALLWLLWQLFGEEVIAATFSTLTIKRHIFGLGQTKTFDNRHIQELHVTPLIHSHACWGRHKQWHTLFEGR